MTDDRVTANVFIALPLFELAAYSCVSITLAAQHRKRESRHDVSGCSVPRSRLRDPAWCTRADRMAAHRKSDRRRGGLCADGLRKRVWKSISPQLHVDEQMKAGMRRTPRS